MVRAGGLAVIHLFSVYKNLSAEVEVILQPGNRPDNCLVI